ncbi:Demethylrebeccamycin-D-glucose O-methyltransferase [Defluviimonas aquaemixtae]|uniref:Demethylrebeccamycin-D-glucose O-methyltransferase n=1 Tax=Albidovulum aquaemixtae TaxID=1542388 RepID=A0A2R8B6S7_9RHOB|nr:class I SAM-dependent methyltransferase [Defluviimonas aquaemixtae]SPH18233.1 Demethylrebeccamycin-D-glucose O-methyltransferase [Defluviimonas aquaemixtae]
MKLLDSFIGRQIRRPSGVPGWLLGHLMANEHKALVDWMLEAVQIGRTDSVLDVGCGGGMTLKTLHSLARDGFVAGVDYSPAMVKQARQRNRRAIENDGMAVLLGDVEALPFGDASFDVVCGVETFYFWPDPGAGLREIFRVLKPRGTVALVMDISKKSPDSPVPEDLAQRMGFHVYSGEEMKELLTDAGFGDVTIKSRPDRAKGWLCACGVKSAAVSGSQRPDRKA